MDRLERPSHYHRSISVFFSCPIYSICIHWHWDSKQSKAKQLAMVGLLQSVSGSTIHPILSYPGIKVSFILVSTIVHFISQPSPHSFSIVWCNPSPVAVPFSLVCPCLCHASAMPMPMPMSPFHVYASFSFPFQHVYHHMWVLTKEWRKRLTTEITKDPFYHFSFSLFAVLYCTVPYCTVLCVLPLFLSLSLHVLSNTHNHLHLSHLVIRFFLCV